MVTGSAWICQQCNDVVTSLAWLWMIFETISNEAHSENDNEMCNHLKEIFVLCKLCLWNSGKFYLEFTPWGVILDSYPRCLPDKYRFNISTIDE